jgi:hypothetical protein
MPYPAHKRCDSTRNNNSIIYIKYTLKRALLSLGNVFTTVLCVRIKNQIGLLYALKVCGCLETEEL